MSLADIIGGMNVSHWTQAALVICLLVFLGVVVWVFSRRNTQTWEQARSMPLHDDDDDQTRTQGRDNG